MINTRPLATVCAVKSRFMKVMPFSRTPSVIAPMKVPTMWTFPARRTEAPRGVRVCSMHVAWRLLLIRPALRNTPVWWLLGKDEGHGFGKKKNRDFQFYATVMFVKEYLLK